MTDSPVTTSVGSAPPAAAPAPPAGLRLLGVALIVPAGIALLWSYVIPTIQTTLRGFQRPALLDRDEPTKWVGGDNYGRLFEDGAIEPYLRAFAFALVPLLIALVVAPLLALLAEHAGKVARLATRALLVAPIVLFAPTAVLAAWVHDGRVSFREARESPLLTNIHLIAALGFGLIVALAATAFLSALRRQAGEGSARRWQAALVVGAVIGLAVLAYGLQVYAVPAALGVTSADSRVPMISVLRSLMTFDLGLGSAASTLLLAALAVLGVAATVTLVGTRTRLELRERVPGAGVGPAWLLPLAVLLVIGVGLTLHVAWPVFASFGEEQRLGPPDLSTGQIVLNTWLPSLISTVVGVSLAALAGFGIGALRPLGRFSELLLLPFAPWLFVTVGPLALTTFDRARVSDSLGTFLSLIPPTWLAVPALFVFTLLGRGQHHRWLQARASGDGGPAAVWRVLVAPQLPMAAVVGVVTWVLSAQDLIWPYIVGNDPDHWSTPLVASMSWSSVPRTSGIGDLLLASLPVVVTLGLILVAAQLFYLDRIAVRVGRPTSPTDHVPAQPAGPPVASTTPAGSAG